MFWDHLSDQGSFILSPPDDELDETTVYKVGPLILDPPDTIPAPEAHDDHPRTGIDSSS